MVSLVVYFSRGKKTRKVAEVIAKELGTEAIDIKKEQPDASMADLLVVGSGTYGSKPGKPLTAYLEDLSIVNDKYAVCFATGMWNPKPTLSAMQKVLKVKGYRILEGFTCYGKWLFIKKGHPTTEDLNKAQEFARQIRMTAKVSTTAH